MPWPPGTEPTGDPLVQAIADAAHELDTLRQNWLNFEVTPNMEQAQIDRLEKDRTLTNLYNAMPEWLRIAHQTLDRAVFAAYGWSFDDLYDPATDTFDEEEILRRLLALNLERAAQQNE
jgi:hypothetical protein